MTSESKNPPLWPFLVLDALFLGLAIFIFQEAHRPLLWWEAGCLILCAAAAAGAFITPFLRRTAQAEAQSVADQLAVSMEKIQKLDQLAHQISNSTAQWQIVQDSAAKTAQTAANLNELMSAEAKSFAEFLQRANDAERAHLRLEAEKLRRAETEWLQVVIRLLDQVHALYQAAVQSGQPGLAEQIGLFQNACRDIPRRVGLAVVHAQPNELFDAKRHEPFNGAPVPEKPIIFDSIAPGYTYQSQLVRRAVVRFQESEPGKPGAEIAAMEKT